MINCLDSRTLQDHEMVSKLRARPYNVQHGARRITLEYLRSLCREAGPTVGMTGKSILKSNWLLAAFSLSAASLNLL